MIKKLLNLTWNKRKFEKGENINLQWSHFCAEFNSKFSVGWSAMKYDGLPLWSLRIGWLWLSGGDCHKWIKCDEPVKYC